MRNLTELLQEIPLDEMTGGLNDMKMTENNERTITDNNSGARIRSKAPAAVAVAACAVVAVFGAVQMSNNKVESGSSVNNSHTDVVENTATDAEDTNEPETDGSNDLLSLPDKEMNYKLSRLTYDENGYDYELVKDKITVLDYKAGMTEAGYENYDIRVADIKVSYPFLEFDVAITSKDGSTLESDINQNGVIFDTKCSIDGRDYTGVSSAFEFYGNTAVNRQTIDLANDVYSINSDSVVHFEIGDIRNIISQYSAGEEVKDAEPDKMFSIDIPVGKYVDLNNTIPHENTIRPDAKGTWLYEGMLSDEKTELNYTVNELSWSSSGMTANVTFDSKKQFDPFELSVDLFGKQLDQARSSEKYRGFSDDTDVFVDVIFSDGTVEDLNVTNTSYSENEDGSIDLYYDTLTTPYNYDEVAAFRIGSEIIPIGAYAESGEEIKIYDRVSNSTASELFYRENGYEYWMTEPNIHVLKDNCGEIKKGFDNLDISVADVKMCYPFLEVEFSAQTRDGSVIAGNDTMDYVIKATVDGEELKLMDNVMNVYGNVATGTQCFDLTGNGKAINKDSIIHFEITRFSDSFMTEDIADIKARGDVVTDYSKFDKEIYKVNELIGEGVFEADIPVKDAFERDENIGKMEKTDINESGTVVFTDSRETTPRTFEYTVKKLAMSESGVEVTIEPGKGGEDMNPYAYKKALGEPQLEKAKIRSDEEHKFDDIDAFIKLEFDDGSIVPLDALYMTVIENEDGTVTFCYDCLRTPFGHDRVNLVHVGSAKVTAPRWIKNDTAYYINTK